MPQEMVVINAVEQMAYVVHVNYHIVVQNAQKKGLRLHPAELSAANILKNKAKP